MEVGDVPFYWQPPPAALYRRRRPPSPSLFGSSLSIILFPCLAVLMLFFVAHRLSHRSPSIYNVPDYPNQISDPIPKLKQIYNLGRSWDALSVVLIVAAILCGVFARRHDRIPSPPVRTPVRQNPNFVVMRSEYGNHCGMQNQFCVPTFRQQHLQQQQWLQFAHGQRSYGFYPNGYNYAWRREEQVAATSAAGDEIRAGDGIEIKEIPMETFEHQSIQNSATIDSASGSPSPPNTPPPPPPRPVSRAKPKRSDQSVPRKEKVEKPAPPVLEHQEEKKLKPRKSSGTKEIAAVLASLYGERKTKRKQQKHNKQEFHGVDEIAVQDDISTLLSRPSESDDFLHKSSNYSQIRYISSDLPPPPAAPPSRHSKRKNQIPPISQSPTELPAADPSPRLQTTTPAYKSRKPPLPARSTTNDGDDNFLNSRRSQPTLPPSPRPPPTITETNFSLVRGDRFIRSRCPPTNLSAETEEEAGLTATAGKDSSGPSDESKMNGGDGGGASPSIFCPSPDVDAKADMFIARHRDSWRLERLNSWREKRA